MKDRVFFMHIAKTAGSYVNELFVNELGTDNAMVQAGPKLRGSDHLREILNELPSLKFISGHIYAPLWREISKEMWGDFKRITVVRNPIDHIASHILWLDHYNLPEKREEYGRLTEAHRRLVDLIGQTDLKDIGSLDHLMTHLPAVGIQLLDNCQSRYFLAGPGMQLKNYDPVTLGYSSAIMRELKTFDLVMTQDNLEKGIKDMNAMLGTKLKPLETRVNEAKSARQIDTQSPMVRNVLGKRVVTDLWLWQHIKRKNA